MVPNVNDAPEVYLNAEPSKAARGTQDAVSYVDADLAGDVDTMRSTTGFAIMMHGGIVNWLSKLQPTVALSTAEAEVIAATELVKQVSHMRLFLRKIGFK